MLNSNLTLLNSQFACSVLYPQTVSCSGHGHCNIISSSCICDSGWSSLGDFAVGDGIDCDQNINIIRILNYVSIIIVIIFLVFITRVLYLRILSKPSIKDPPILCSIMFLIVGLMGFSYSIIKIINPTEYLVGNSPLITFFFCSTMFFFIMGYVIFIVILGLFFKGYAKSMSSEARAKVERVIKFQERSFIFIFIIALISSYMPLIGIAFPKSIEAFYTAFFIGISVVWLCLVLIILSHLNVMKTELKLADSKSSSSINESSITKENISPFIKIHNRLVVIDTIFKLVSPSAIGVMFALGVWPYLQRKVSYFIPALSLTSSIVMPMGVFLYLPSQTFPCNRPSSSDSSRRGSTIKAVPSNRIIPLNTNSNSEYDNTMTKSDVVLTDLNDEENGLSDENGDLA